MFDEKVRTRSYASRLQESFKNSEKVEGDTMGNRRDNHRSGNLQQQTNLMFKTQTTEDDEEEVKGEAPMSAAFVGKRRRSNLKHGF